MSSHLYISDPFTKSRKLLEKVDLQKNVLDLKIMIKNLTSIQPEEQELIYFGECLEENNVIASYGIKTNSTIFVKKRIEENSESLEDTMTSINTVEEIEACLKTLRNPNHRVALKKYVRDKTKIENLVSSNEVIRDDRVLKILMNDSDLLLTIIESASPTSIMKTYPNLVLLLQMLATATSEGTSSRFGVANSDDIEDRNYEGFDPALLAQAEMAASGEEAMQQHQQRSSNGQQHQSRPQFSTSDLANALSFATTLSSEGEPSNTQNEDQVPEALEQMRAVGIMNDELSRRALRLSGGNVEAAINLIFEGTLT